MSMDAEEINLKMLENKENIDSVWTALGCVTLRYGSSTHLGQATRDIVEQG